MLKKVSAKTKERIGQLFDTYAKNLELYVPVDRAWFLCPICWRAFPREAIEWGHINLAHIIPKFLGGRECTILCHSCNSNFGSTIESKAYIGHEFYNPIMTGGEPKVRAPMSLKYLDQEFHFFATHSSEKIPEGNVFSSSINADHMNPRDAEELVNLMTQLATKSEKISITIEEPGHYDGNIAKNLDILVAFLAMFDLMGFEFALSCVGAGMRDLLVEPDSEIEMQYFLPKSGQKVQPGKVLLLQSDPPSFIVGLPVCKPFLDERLIWIPPLIGPNADWTNLEGASLAKCRAVELKQFDLASPTSASIYHRHLYGKTLRFDIGDPI